MLEASRVFVVLTIILSGLFHLPAASADDEALRRVNLSILADRRVLQPAANGNISARIGVLFQIDPDWHIYWKNSGEAGIPTQVVWNLPTGWSASALRWPAPLKFLEGGDITTFGYVREVLLIADVVAPANGSSVRETVEISADVSWLVCKEICIPGRKTVSAEFGFSETDPLAPSKSWPVFEYFEALTPRSPAEAGLPFKIDPVILSLTAAPNAAEFTAAISLSGLTRSRLNLARHIQLFPESESALSGLHAYIAEPEGRAVVVLPATLAPEGQGAADAAGILVFSKELLGTDSDVSVRWTTPVRVAEQAVPNAVFDTLHLGTAEKRPLTFRMVGHAADTAPMVQDSGFSWIAFFAALASAFAAGLLLNLMPCVLPILSIKALGFVEHRSRDRLRGIVSGLFFALGIISSLLLLALVIIVLKSSGMQFGWGFQFQYPAFVFTLLLVVFILSLGLFELYHFSLPFLGGAGKAVDEVQHPWIKSFFEGVLTTALATPCTAPFLGVALAFAFSQSWYVTLAIFFAIGVGLSLPYLAVVSSPRLMSLIPRPGPWMKVFREAMAFLLLATALWLLFVLDRQLEGGALAGLMGLFWTFVCVWLYRVWLQTRQARLRRLLLLVAWMLLIAYIWPIQEKTESSSRCDEASARQDSSSLINWQPFMPDVLDAQSGQTVFIDFTADWCITCKANEKFVLNTLPVAQAFKQHNVLAVRADWTRGQSDVTAALQRFNANGVPLYVVLKDEKVMILPTILTKSIVLKAISSQ